jgi:hypothetical protein
LITLCFKQHAEVRTGQQPFQNVPPGLAQEIPTLADAFGDSIFNKRESGETRIRSIGRNGRNDNSSGNWEGQPEILFKISK